MIRDLNRLTGLGARHRNAVSHQVPVQVLAFALEIRVQHLASHRPGVVPAKPPPGPRAGRTP